MVNKIGCSFYFVNAVGFGLALLFNSSQASLICNNATATLEAFVSCNTANDLDDGLDDDANLLIFWNIYFQILDPENTANLTIDIDGVRSCSEGIAKVQLCIEESLQNCSVEVKDAGNVAFETYRNNFCCKQQGIWKFTPLVKNYIQRVAALENFFINDTCADIGESCNFTVFEDSYFMENSYPAVKQEIDGLFTSFIECTSVLLYKCFCTYMEAQLSHCNETLLDAQIFYLLLVGNQPGLSYTFEQAQMLQGNINQVEDACKSANYPVCDEVKAQCSSSKVTHDGSFIISRGKRWTDVLEDKTSAEYTGFKAQVRTWFGNICSDCQNINLVFSNSDTNVKVTFGMTAYSSTNDTYIGEAIGTDAFLGSDAEAYDIDATSIRVGSYLAPSTEVSVELEEVDVTITITSEDFTPELEDKASDSYLALAQIVIDWMEPVCSCRVVNVTFRNGSILVDYEIVFPKEEEEDQLFVNIFKSIEDDTFTGNTQYTVNKDNLVVDQNTVDNVFDSVSGEFTIINQELSTKIQTELNTTLVQEFENVCKASTDIIYCSVVDLKYSKGSINVKFTLLLPAFVTNKTFFHAWEKSIKDGTFLSEYNDDIDLHSLAFGTVYADAGLSTLAVIGISVGVFLFLILIAIAIAFLCILLRQSLPKKGFDSHALPSAQFHFPHGVKRRQLAWQTGKPPGYPPPRSPHDATFNYFAHYNAGQQQGPNKMQAQHAKQYYRAKKGYNAPQRSYIDWSLNNMRDYSRTPQAENRAYWGWQQNRG